MSDPLVECVPNFSEGRDTSIVARICEAIASSEKVELLHVDSGAGLNRTVVTFIGDPQAALHAAFRSIAKAAELIDMRHHSGIHPRMGSTDVCPLVPFRKITMDRCAELSRRLAKRVGEELGIPVYLYEKAAQIAERRSLAKIRAGEYEGLKGKMTDPFWKPDFGPTEFNERSGATVIGARDFLIAFNINLHTREPRIAKDIALELRTKGRSARRGNTHPIYLSGEEILRYRKGCYPCGRDNFIGSTILETAEHCQRVHGYDLLNLLELNGIDPRQPEGRSVKIPGRFAQCKAMGWWVPEYNCSQVSTNLTDFEVTCMHDVYEETRRLAAARNVDVTGSEIVGMVPYQALLKSGQYYLESRQQVAGLTVGEVLQAAVKSLGLATVAAFDIPKRVLALPKDLDHPAPIT